MSFEIDFRDWAQSKGRIRYGYVPWDSEIFGFSCYQLSLSEAARGLANPLSGLLDFLVEQSGGQCLVFTKVSASEVHWLQALGTEGFYQVETTLEPYRSLRSFELSRRFERLRLRPAQAADRSELLFMARNAFTMDRYHLDPNLPADRASYRYEYWLNDGFQSGDPIYVYEDAVDDRSIGFFHLKQVSGAVVDLSLAAIDPESQKGGLGALMYGECLLECKKLGYKQAVTRISVNNIAVLNIYSHLGFLFRKPTSTLHWYANRV